MRVERGGWSVERPKLGDVIARSVEFGEDDAAIQAIEVAPTYVKASAKQIYLG